MVGHRALQSDSNEMQYITLSYSILLTYSRMNYIVQRLRTQTPKYIYTTSLNYITEYKVAAFR